ncbi:MAG: DUF3761 domain-containing protein [Acidobacteria bacterium]|nr:DUF3761 domain-containing protein [Acidobacteriota bacterium]
MRRSSRRTIVVIAVLAVIGGASAPVADAQNLSRQVLYSGSHNGTEILALSVGSVPTQAQLDAIAEELLASDTRLLIYRGYPSLSEARPIAVYQDGQRALIDLEAPVTRSGTTVQSEISSAVRSSGRRTGATCKDGSSSSATGRGACSHHGGVRRWRYGTTRDTNKVVASICADLKLVAGERCGRMPSIAKVRNTRYAVPSKVRGVSFLPEPSTSPAAGATLGVGAISGAAVARVPALPPFDQTAAEVDGTAEVTDVNVKWGSVGQGLAASSRWEISISRRSMRSAEAGVELQLVDAAGETVWRQVVAARLGGGNEMVRAEAVVPRNAVAAAVDYSADLLWVHHQGPEPVVAPNERGTTGPDPATVEYWGMTATTHFPGRRGLTSGTVDCFLQLPVVEDSDSGVLVPETSFTTIERRRNAAGVEMLRVELSGGTRCWLEASRVATVDR